ncbi:MAG: sulfatase-like hydrolase/transferase [Cyclobacteriaceae bacterium]
MVIKEKLINGLKDFIILALIFLAEISAIRVYEFILISSGNKNALGLEFQGLIYDVFFSLSVAGILLIVHLLFSIINNKLANIISVILLTLFILLSFCLVQYFSVTLIPLSTDLFGYSIRDIKTVLNSSGGTNASTFVILFLFVAAFIFLNILALKKEYGKILNQKLCLALGFLMLACSLIGIKPTPESYNNDVEYYFAANKTDFFLRRTWEYLTEAQDQKFGDNDYPFLHKVDYNSNLAKYFNLEKERPTIVFLIIEGLGRDFVGRDSQFGGFTPFLDSLSQKSLYWPNALSNAGRTFGVLPSLLGSLPYGKDGFMSYSEIPAHQSIISILKPYGYKTNFFYGGNPNFDNMDVFLENEGIDFTLDEGKFPASYRKMGLNSGGFSWGFGDDEVFTYANEIITKGNDSPRLDIYLTLSTHEPFQVPDSSFNSEFDKIIKGENKTGNEDYFRNKNIFSCLLYTDHAIKKFFDASAKLPTFKNTIFVITGDHRLIPIPPSNKLSRFHVPLIIYSPLLKQPVQFKSLVTHSSVTPSLLSLLKNYGLTFPSEMPFISDSLSTSSHFSSNVDIALIRNKNETIDYIEGTHFLSEGRLFEIQPNFDLEPVADSEVSLRLKQKLKNFKAKSIHAIENNRLDKSTFTAKNKFVFAPDESKYITGNRLSELKPDDLFFKARQLAFDKAYKESSIVSRFLLNKSPNYHDARVLLGRVFAWQSKYDTARYFLNQVLTRNPKYADAYNALADIEYWNGQNENSLKYVMKGLENNPNDLELMARQARALIGLGKKSEAKKIVKAILSQQPQQEMANDLQKRLQ